MSKTATKPAPVKPPAGSANARTPRLELLGSAPLKQIKPSPLNPRKSFPPVAGAELIESVKAHGILQPLLVRPVGKDGKRPVFGPSGWTDLAHFELVDGERRFNALEEVPQAHKDKGVPVMIREMTDAEALACMLVSCEQREDVLPSEKAAGYAKLRAELGEDEKVARAVGKPVGYVRGLLRLGKLPAWALAAVDAGTLPRATAEVVARVPGEESRELAACCVWLDTMDLTDARHCLPSVRTGKMSSGSGNCMSSRDAKDLIGMHFTKELKGCPFDRKSLDLLPEAGSCEACPKRAGNDPEAVAEGTRADVCLDPDCYRAKVEAYRAKEIAKAEAKGIEVADLGLLASYSGGMPPRGWCDVAKSVSETELAGDFPNKMPEGALKKLIGDDCPLYIAFGAGGKSVLLAKTSEARKALIELKVLKKPEKREGAPKPKASRNAAAPQQKGPLNYEIEDAAALTACGVLFDFGSDQFAALDTATDCDEDGPILEGLRFVVRAFAYDALVFGDGAVADVLERRFKGLTRRVADRKSDERVIDEFATSSKPSHLLAALLELATARELCDVPQRLTAHSILAWAELDWDTLRQQAERELSGGEPAEAKPVAEKVTPVAAAEAPAPVVATTCVKCGAAFDSARKKCPSCGWVQPAAAPQPAGTPLASVPGFPEGASAHLALHGVVTVEQLEAKRAEFAKEKTKGEITVYGAMRELNVPGDDVLDAGDALSDWTHAPAIEAEKKAKEAAAATNGKPAKPAKKKGGVK